MKPPENTEGRPARRPPKRLLLRRKYPRAPLATSSYPKLLLTRYAEGLLLPFRCAGCGQMSLDPIGRRGTRGFLCDACSS
jgi:hypothetical protein